MNFLFYDCFVPLTHKIVLFNLSLKTNTLLPVVWVYAWYRNRNQVNSLEGCVATTTPTILRRYTIKEMTSRSFKPWFFLTNFLSVTSRKNQNYFLRSGVVFSLTRLICFSLIESCCFWFVTSWGHWEVKKWQQFSISWLFCPSNAHNSIVQSFPENKYSFTGRLSVCIVPESKPCQQRGRLRCYHYTNDTETVYNRRDDFQKFQTLTSRSFKLSINEKHCFSLIESCCFWFVTSRGPWEVKKRQELTILWMF